MSNKIKQQTKDNTRKLVIKPEEFQFLVNMDRVQKSMSYYHDQLKMEYLHKIAVDKGYDPEEQLEFSIDLATTTRELTIKKIS